MNNTLRNLVVVFFGLGALHGCMDELPGDEAKFQEVEQAEEAAQEPAQAGDHVELRGGGVCCFGGTWTCPSKPWISRDYDAATCAGAITWTQARNSCKTACGANCVDSGWQSTC